jgi:tetratricopeptide (TPR) repeat protein
MRLLEHQDGKFKLTNDLVRDIPRYAILSHTWGLDTEEVTFKDVVHGTGEGKIGWDKVRFCAEQARRDGLQYFWVDTCCIDKSNHTELSGAINSMFRWYQNAARCYVYLSGISTTDYDGNQSELPWESEFRSHRWFTRGWTLQELLAPSSVEFFTQDGQRLGDKRSLQQQIHEITGIAIPALEGRDLSQFTIQDRFKWAEKRETSFEEDSAYSLLGIFGVVMPFIPGEGKESAMYRLRKEIDDAMSRDMSGRQANVSAWMVPFERNLAFTGRDAELTRLRQALFTGQKTAKVAVTGLGGVGKTQLALELVYQVRDRHKNCSVIWIPVTSKESLEQAYLKAAEELGVPGCEDDSFDIKGLVRDYLSTDKAGQWLLVFDNADDISMWVDEFAPASGRLIDYLPKSSSGSIIFTTRDKKAAVTLAGRNVIEMREMDDAGGRRLLAEYLIDQDLDQDDATALLTRLTYLPLAIVQAAVYMNANEIGLAEYLSLLGEQEEDEIEFLSEDFEDEGRYRGLNNPVATTWLISFEQIRERDPLAAEYLSFMACVDAKDIPQSLLPPGSSRKKERDAMGTLQGYSFIVKRSADSAINIHRLVHLATRNWLRKEGMMTLWTEKTLKRLVDVLRNIDDDTRVVWRPLMPHAYYALKSATIDSDDEDMLKLLNIYGECLNYDGRYVEAEASFKQEMDLRMAKHGIDHLSTLDSMASLATAYGNQGRWKEAEDLEVVVLEAHKAKLGDEHLSTVRSMSNLASTYWSQGRLNEAEELETQALAIRKVKLGPDHPNTLTIMSNLAATYLEQGRWKEAEELEAQVLEMSKIKLGVDHSDVLISMDNLASIYREQGRWAEAEDLGAQALEIAKVKLGADHLDTLTIMSNLGSTYRRQGRWDEAEQLEIHVLDISKAKLEADHPDILTSMGNLASIYWSQDRLKEAEDLALHVYQTSKVKLGAEHLDTLTTMGNLARIYQSLGRWKEAEELETTVLQSRKSNLGPIHPETLTSMANLATTYRCQGRLDEAEELQTKELEICTKVLGPRHPNTLVSMSNLSYIWESKGRHREALELMQSCYQLRLEILGVDHPTTLSSLSALTEWQDETDQDMT